MRQHDLPVPRPPARLADDGTGPHTYALISVGPQGARSAASTVLKTAGRAELKWDSAPGADSYVVLCDGEPVGPAVRIEGTEKRWRDPRMK
jgi:hypothetical protein